MLKKSIPCGARGLDPCAKRNMHSAKRKERGGRTNEIDFCTLVCVSIFFEETLSSTARALKLMDPGELGKHSGEPHLICCKFVLRRDSHANFATAWAGTLQLAQR